MGYDRMAEIQRDRILYELQRIAEALEKDEEEQKAPSLDELPPIPPEAHHDATIVQRRDVD